VAVMSGPGAMTVGSIRTSFPVNAGYSRRCWAQPSRCAMRFPRRRCNPLAVPSDGVHMGSRAVGSGVPAQFFNCKTQALSIAAAVAAMPLCGSENRSSMVLSTL